ncbi:hypothetical protein AAF712_013069 [Marasmius tenuissimus]|uniref:F-box domain-containing protein n=1 Tax=Marasmius tenuissimus TaxID=585030 RepID=A0ABR2ZFQ3_9AGAR
MPIKNLSVEVLDEVFYNYAANDGRAQTLVQVCTKWNAIVTQRPRLWTLVVVDLSEVEKPGDPYQHAIMGLEKTLQRSNRLPLTIQFADSHPGTSRTSSLSRDIMLQLFRESMRWKSASLRLDPHQGACRLFTHNDYRLDRRRMFKGWYFSNLEALTITTFGNMPLKVLDYFAPTPSLTTVRVPTLGDIFRPMHSEYHAGIASFVLEHLALDFSADLSLIHWLDRFKRSILSCDVKTLNHFPDGILPATLPPYVVELPKLVSLAVPQGHARAVDSLRLPQLGYLTLYANNAQPFDLSEIRRLLDRSACRLRRLEIFAPVAVPISDIEAVFPLFVFSETKSEGASNVRKVYFSQEPR